MSDKPFFQVKANKSRTTSSCTEASDVGEQVRFSHECYLLLLVHGIDCR